MGGKGPALGAHRPQATDRVPRVGPSTSGNRHSGWVSRTSTTQRPRLPSESPRGVVVRRGILARAAASPVTSSFTRSSCAGHLANPWSSPAPRARLPPCCGRHRPKNAELVRAMANVGWDPPRAAGGPSTHPGGIEATEGLGYCQGHQAGGHGGRDGRGHEQGRWCRHRGSARAARSPSPSTFTQLAGSPLPSSSWVGYPSSPPATAPVAGVVSSRCLWEASSGPSQAPAAEAARP